MVSGTEETSLPNSSGRDEREDGRQRHLYGSILHRLCICSGGLVLSLCAESLCHAGVCFVARQGKKKRGTVNARTSHLSCGAGSISVFVSGREMSRFDHPANSPLFTVPWKSASESKSAPSCVFCADAGSAGVLSLFRFASSLTAPLRPRCSAD